MPNLVTVTADDGLQFSGLLAGTTQKHVVIIYIHGMQGDFCTGLEPYFEGYPAQGIAFLSGEHRGCYIAKRFNTDDGQGRVAGGAYERFEDCVPDITAWIDYAKWQGYQNIWLAAHSLATAKVAYYMHQTKDQHVKGLILLSPSDNSGLVKDPEGAADHAVCLPEAQRLQAEGHGGQLLNHRLWGDKVLSVDTYLNLFGNDSKANVFHYHNPAGDWRVVNGLKVPVIAFTGTNDDGITPVIDPGEAMKMLEVQLHNVPRVRTVVLDGADHSFGGYEPNIITEVTRFIDEI